MGKRIYWILIVLIALAGLTTMIYYGIQPRPIPKIKLSRFESHLVLANSMLLRLREEIKSSPIVFLGVNPENPEHFQVWREFLNQNHHEADMAYDLIVMDQELTTDLFPEAQKVRTKGDFTIFLQGVQKALAEGHRIAVIVPTVYSVQMIPGNFAAHFKQGFQSLPEGQRIQPTSLSLTDFPRSREQEKEMPLRCIVEGVDQTGLGPYGCLIVQMARASYRKRFSSGDAVGMVYQIGARDYLVLYTKEK